MDDTDIITYFEIPGQPRPQPRHRSTKFGGHYIPADAPIRAWKDAIRLAAKLAGLTPHGDAVFMTQHFFLTRPASHVNAAGEVKPSATIKNPPGDNDNYEKALWDALIGFAYHDDRQVLFNYTGRMYAAPGEAPKALVEIRKVKR